ncbi:MAG: hypothetical protein FJZ01_07685 [Candidatus Sericytochromatia bacterium]|nr:hypothetical protein [Candidatus Tanganyikabacteria bacterium]
MNAVAKAAKKGIWKGGCIPPRLRVATAIKNAISSRPGAGAMQWDKFTLSQASRQSWKFQGTGVRQHMVHGHPLGGSRLEISGVWNSLKQEFTKYSEKVIGLIRG